MSRINKYRGPHRPPGVEDWVIVLMICIALMVVLSSCALEGHRPSLNLKEGVVYKNDMQICLDGKCREGVIVGKRKGEYKFKIKAHGRLELFTFATCHREETTERHSKPKWRKNDRIVEGIYHPSPGIEDGHCPVYIGGYNHKNRHSWAFADFEDPEYTLPANLHCNGAFDKYNGVSVCQSRAGLLQVIEFEEPVKVAACGITGKAKRWEIIVNSGECVAVFFGAKSMHRLTLIGYDKIIVRKD